jgi:hypothetical protein
MTALYFMMGSMGHDAIRSLTTEPGSRWTRKSWPKNTFVVALELPLPRLRPYSLTVIANDLRAPWEPTQEDLWAQDWMRVAHAN